MLPRLALILAAALLLAFGMVRSAHAMHISEGFLPPMWAAVWLVAVIPFFLWGLRSIARQVNRSPQSKITLGMSGAYAFVLSGLKLPSVTGSCSHPTGVALGAILFGPTTMVVLGTIVLLFQAIILAHGGLTTLGANVFSMALVGPFVAYGVFRAFRGLGLTWAVFLAAALADWTTYIVTAGQLALAAGFSANHVFEVGPYAITAGQLGLAWSGATGGIIESFVKFLGIFAFTQVPLAIAEGILTVIVFNLLVQHSRDVLVEQGILPAEAPTPAPGATAAAG